MAKNNGIRLRDLPAEQRREVNRAKAAKLTELVKADEAKAKAAEHQRTIDQLTGKDKE